MAGAAHAPSPNIVEVLLAILIVTSLVLQVVLHALERWIALSHVHLQAVLRNLYRELMVLGLVSFIFVFYAAVAKPSATAIASFEFAHVFIFALAVVHTAVVLIAAAASLSLSRRWKRMEQMDIIRYLEMKEEFRRLRNRINLHAGIWWRNAQWWLPNPRALLRHWRLHEVMAFHDIRFQFLFYRDLPEDFNFSSYLRKVKAVTFIELVDAHWSLWLVLLVIVLSDIVRRQFWNSAVFESAFAIGAAVFLIAMAALLNQKIRRVYWTLTKHPATYFNNITKETVLAESTTSASPSTAAEPATRTPDSFPNTLVDATGARPMRSGPADSNISAATQLDLIPHTNAHPGQPPGPDESGNVADDELTDRESPTTTGPCPADTTEPEVTPHPATVVNSSAVTNPALVPATTSSTQRPMLLGATIIDMTDVGEQAQQTAPYANPMIVVRDGGRIATTTTPTPRQQIRPMVATAHGQKFGQTLGARSSFEGSRITNLMYNQSRPSLDEWHARGKQRPRHKAKNRRPPQPPAPSDDDLAEIAVRHSIAHPAANSRRMSLEERRTNYEPQRLAGQSLQLPLLPHPNISTSPLTSTSPSPPAQLDLVSANTFSKTADTPGNVVIVPHRLRVSMDESHRSPRSSLYEPRKARRGTSLDESHSFRGRLSVDEAQDGSRRSIEMKARLPIDELVGRDVPALVGTSQHMDEYTSEGDLTDASTQTGFGRASMDRRRETTAKPDKPPPFVNPSLIHHVEHAANARQQAPGGNYPNILTKVIPRLARVASPAEKLFWFGSHRFFLWCVEFVLFMSTVLLASVLSAVVLVLRNEKQGSVSALILVSLGMSILTQVYVLTRVSYMMKKYIFVLNNAGLVPEVLALQVIHNLHHRRQMRMEQNASDNDQSDMDSPDDDSEAAKERRRNFSRFFFGDAQNLNVLGLRPNADAAGEELRFWRESLQLRQLRRRRRKRSTARVHTAQEPIPLVPGTTSPNHGGNGAVSDDTS
jgi:Mlo family